jgi:hypothetical protein
VISRIESYLVGKCRRVSPHKPAAVPYSTESSSLQRLHRSATLICMSRKTHALRQLLTKSQIAQLKGVPGAPHQIFPPYSVSAAFASPPFPSRPGISIPIDSHSEGMLMAGNQKRRSLRIWEKRAKQNRRMSFMIIL